MKIRSAILVFVLVFSPGLLTADERHTPPPTFEPTWPWITSLEEAVKQSRQTGKPILAEFR